MFPLAGHSIQWIWTGFGVRPQPANGHEGVIFAQKPRDCDTQAPWAASECLA